MSENQRPDSFDVERTYETTHTREAKSRNTRKKAAAERAAAVKQRDVEDCAARGMQRSSSLERSVLRFGSAGRCLRRSAQLGFASECAELSAFVSFLCCCDERCFVFDSFVSPLLRVSPVLLEGTADGHSGSSADCMTVRRAATNGSRGETGAQRARGANSPHPRLRSGPLRIRGSQRLWEGRHSLPEQRRGEGGASLSAAVAAAPGTLPQQSRTRAGDEGEPCITRLGGTAGSEPAGGRTRRSGRGRGASLALLDGGLAVGWEG